MNPLIATHRETILALAHRYGVRNVRVFGSMARGEGRQDSDVDFLVEVDDGVSGLRLGALLMDLQELLGRRVDLLTEAAIHPRLRERVVEESVPI